MAFLFAVLSALFAYASAGLLGAPATLSTAPLAYGAAPLAYGHAPVAYGAAPLAIARAAPLAVAHAPVAAIAKTVVADDYDPNPQYQYGYDVQDALTGDSKSQVESRSGDVVQGSYSLVDPDGTRRTVEYTADPINGFNAVVHREPLVAKVATVAKVAAPVAHYAAAPVAHYAAAPIAARYASPLLASPYAAAPLISKYGGALLH